MPKVSVIVPVYNSEKYLRQCLDSIQAQTLSDIEIICINDGSEDLSPDILLEYARNDGRFIVINKKNEGYGCAMNDGFEIAQGEYIGIVESDDLADYCMYADLYKIACANDADVVKADFYRFIKDKDGKTVKFYEHAAEDPKAYGRVVNPADDDRIFRYQMNTWSGIYKREFIEKYHIRHNTTPGASFQDNGFWFQTLALAQRVYFVDKPYYMNRRDNAASSVMSKGKVFCMNDEYAFIHDFLEQNPPVKEKFIYAYSLKRVRNYFWNYKRIAKELRRSYLRKISKELKEAQAAGELAREYFTPLEWRRIRMIIENPDGAQKKLDLSFRISDARQKISRKK